MFPILGSDLRSQLPASRANLLPFQQVLALFTHKAVSINLPMGPFYLPFSLTKFQIATNLCICHNSCTVLAGAKICGNYINTLFIRTKWFHGIPILKGEALVEYAIDHPRIRCEHSLGSHDISMHG